VPSSHCLIVKLLAQSQRSDSSRAAWSPREAVTREESRLGVTEVRFTGASLRSSGPVIRDDPGVVKIRPSSSDWPPSRGVSREALDGRYKYAGGRQRALSTPGR
jgi:hypothetical protein